LHYVADELLTEFPQAGRAGRYDSVFKRATAPGKFAVAPGEFDDVLDQAFQAAIDASRAFDLGDFVTAIEKIEPAPLPSDGSKPTARYWITRRIAARLQELKGADFVRLAGRLAEQHARMEGMEAGAVHA
jgi:hypothetical protein